MILRTGVNKVNGLSKYWPKFISNTLVVLQHINLKIKILQRLPNSIYLHAPLSNNHSLIYPEKADDIFPLSKSLLWKQRNGSNKIYITLRRPRG